MKKRGYNALFFFLCFFLSSCMSLKHPPYVHYTPRKGYFFIEDFLFDTGAMKSCISSIDSLDYKGKFRLSKVRLSDANNKGTVQSKYFIRKLSLTDSISARNVSFIQIPPSAIFVTTLKINGIIGMDIISRKNWLIDNIVHKNRFLIAVMQTTANIYDHKAAHLFMPMFKEFCTAQNPLPTNKPKLKTSSPSDHLKPNPKHGVGLKKQIVE